MASNAVAEKAADKVISGVKQVQDISINAISTVTGLVGGFLPDLPSLPLAEKLPQPETVVKATFSIVEDVVKTNKQYALNLVQAFQPLTGKIVPPVRKTRKTAEKA
ncbi:MAG: hypothetical protein ACYDCC_11765 [Actinomycetota bacterium]